MGASPSALPLCSALSLCRWHPQSTQPPKLDTRASSLDLFLSFLPHLLIQVITGFPSRNYCDSVPLPHPCPRRCPATGCHKGPTCSSCLRAL